MLVEDVQHGSCVEVPPQPTVVAGLWEDLLLDSLGRRGVGAEACWGLFPLDQEERIAGCGSSVTDQGHWRSSVCLVQSFLTQLLPEAVLKMTLEGEWFKPCRICRS